MSYHILSPLFLSQLFLLLITVSSRTITIDPQTRVNYDKTHLTGFDWTKFGGHHGVNEPSNAVNTIKKLNAFPDRWLGADKNYFNTIPSLPGSNLPDLTWFDDPINQAKVLSSYPLHLSQFGNEKTDLIYCIEGCTWPSYMLKDPNDFIPSNYTAATNLIIKSLEVIYNSTKTLPKYFEPQNEPYSPKFGKGNTLSTRVGFQNHIDHQIYEYFRGKNMGNDMIIGGPTEDGVGWFQLVSNGGSGRTWIYNVTFRLFIEYGMKNIVGLEKFFVSWHQFSSMKVVNVSDPKSKLCKYFLGSGTVSATMDIVESEMDKVDLLSKNNGKGGRILISEHGLATDPGAGIMNRTNSSYLEYIATNVYLTDLMLYLERPESQWKTNAFYLMGKNAQKSRFPLLIAFQNGTITPTGHMYEVQTALKENNGFTANVKIQPNNLQTDDIKVLSLLNETTNQLVIVIKEISWKYANQPISIAIDGWQTSDSQKPIDIQRIFWDGKFRNEKSKVQANSNGQIDLDLRSGETVVLSGMSYKKQVPKSMICRERYYSEHFAVQDVRSIVRDDLLLTNVVISKFMKGVVRIGMSWDMSVVRNNEQGIEKLTPVSVLFNNVSLKLSLKRVDFLNECGRMAWAAFEYQIQKVAFESWIDGGVYPVVVKFQGAIEYAYVTSIVAEVWETC